MKSRIWNSKQSSFTAAVIAAQNKSVECFSPNPPHMNHFWCAPTISVYCPCQMFLITHNAVRSVVRKQWLGWIILFPLRWRVWLAHVYPLQLIKCLVIPINPHNVRAATIRIPMRGILEINLHLLSNEIHWRLSWKNCKILILSSY